MTESKLAVSNSLDIMKSYQGINDEFQGFLSTNPGIEEINQNARSIQTALSNLISLLAKVQKSLEILCNKSIETLKNNQHNILKFLEVLQDAGIDVIMLSKPFEEVIGQAIGDIEELKLGKDAKYAWKEILENLEELKLKLFKEVENILDKKQFDVLLAVVNASSKQKWFDLSALRKDLLTKFDMNERDIAEIIDSLVERKMLKQGISLPI